MLKIYSFMSFALSKVNRDLSLKEMVRGRKEKPIR